MVLIVAEPAFSFRDIPLQANSRDVSPDHDETLS